MRPAILVLVVSTAVTQAPSPSGEKIEAARATEAAAAAKKAAQAYKVTTGEAGGNALQLESKSLLSWSNPVAGSFHGSVFLWTAKGKPEVVASIYKKYEPLPLHLGIEFHSLTESSATAERDGQAEWSPVRGGVKFRPVPGAPGARRHAGPRLRQIRAIAAEFSATKTDRKRLARPLRLLTQPVYRYEITDNGGALFAFVEGTDPEVFLLIEARKGDTGPAWHYAARKDEQRRVPCWRIAGMKSGPHRSSPGRNAEPPRAVLAAHLPARRRGQSARVTGGAIRNWP